MLKLDRRWKFLAAVLVLVGLGFVVTFLVVSLTGVTDDLGTGAKNLGAEPREIVRGIYHLGKTSPGAAYAIDTTDGIVLIDSGLEPSAANIAAQMSELGLEFSRVKAILLTHAHADHSLGAERIRSKTGARIYAGKEDCDILRAGGPRIAFLSTFTVPVQIHPTEIDVPLIGGEKLTFGDVRIEAVAAPGHSPGSMCYLLERKGLRALFTGDAIQTLNPLHRDALGTYVAYLPPAYRGDAAAYLATLRRLRELPLPQLILPGHPGMEGKEQRPRVPVEVWNRLLDQGIAAMEKLVARYAADGANFLDGNAKRLLPGLQYFGDFHGYAVYGLQTKDGGVVVDAPGGAGLAEFLGEQMRKAGWGNEKLIAVLLTSAAPEAIAGLSELVGKHGCKVFVAKAGVREVRKLLPDAHILDEDGLQKTGWLDVKTVLLEGRGIAPVAYHIQWAGKTVLLTGRMPVRPTGDNILELVRELNPIPGAGKRYEASLQVLGRDDPDLWLPAYTGYGQNANLYDQDWTEILQKNSELLRE